ncbi:MAG: hypothetical protein V9E96_05755 [Chitinophagaceae bacterium]
MQHAVPKLYSPPIVPPLTVNATAGSVVEHKLADDGVTNTSVGVRFTLTTIESILLQPLNPPPLLSIADTKYLVVSVGLTDTELPVKLPGFQVYV